MYFIMLKIYKFKGYRPLQSYIDTEVAYCIFFYFPFPNFLLTFFNSLFFLVFLHFSFFFYFLISSFNSFSFYLYLFVFVLFILLPVSTIKCSWQNKKCRIHRQHRKQIAYFESVGRSFEPRTAFSDRHNCTVTCERKPPASGTCSLKENKNQSEGKCPRMCISLTYCSYLWRCMLTEVRKWLFSASRQRKFYKRFFQSIQKYKFSCRCRLVDGVLRVVPSYCVGVYLH